METIEKPAETGHENYGLITKLTVFAVKSEEMIGLLSNSAAGMPGCLSYVVAEDQSNENVIWVTEVWDNVSSHNTSMSLPAVKNAAPRAKAVIKNFEKVALTNPVWFAVRVRGNVD